MSTATTALPQGGTRNKSCSEKGKNYPKSDQAHSAHRRKQLKAEKRIEIPLAHVLFALQVFTTAL